MSTTSLPGQRRRPANRRALIVEAAVELFAERGYENVGMGDIAAAVSVGASALYRHFPSKVDLLATTIAEVTAELATLPVSADLPATFQKVAAYAVDHRVAGMLWQRESRQLPEPARAPLRDDLRSFRDHVAAAIAGAVPEGISGEQAHILSIAALGAIFSPSFHHTTLERPAFEELLTALAVRAAGVAVPQTTPSQPKRCGVRHASRREELIAAAMRLFAERTYASVSVEEVAAAAGMATSSVYHQFSSKADILWLAIQRGTGYLQLTLNQALADADGPHEALLELALIYAQFAVLHPELVDAMITEVRNSSTDGREAAARTAQREYVGEWVNLYCLLHADVDRPTATVVVQAALTVINDLARTPAFRAREDAPALAAQFAGAVLGL